MTDLFILGAGFSKAIYNSMPTMDELSSAVLQNREKAGLPVDALHRLGSNIELWMTYLSQSQPWLKTTGNDFNKAFAGQLREQIKKIMRAGSLWFFLECSTCSWSFPSLAFGLHADRGLIPCSGRGAGRTEESREWSGLPMSA